LDEAAMRRQAQVWFEKLKASYPERDYKHRPVEELFLPSLRTISPSVG